MSDQCHTHTHPDKLSDFSFFVISTVFSFLISESHTHNSSALLNLTVFDFFCMYLIVWGFKLLLVSSVLHVSMRVCKSECGFMYGNLNVPHSLFIYASDGACVSVWVCVGGWECMWGDKWTPRMTTA